jgi:hypothetical protein
MMEFDPLASSMFEMGKRAPINDAGSTPTNLPICPAGLRP